MAKLANGVQKVLPEFQKFLQKDGLPPIAVKSLPDNIPLIIH